MKNLIQQFKQSLHDLIYGRVLPESLPKVRIVNIQKSPLPTNTNVPVKTQPAPLSITEAAEITKRAVLSQSGESPVVLPFDDSRLLVHITNKHRELMFKYFLKRLNVAINNNLPAITIFQFGSSAKVAQIGKSNYEAQLNLMMKWFIETEDYESAGSCRDLLRQLNVKNVTD